MRLDSVAAALVDSPQQLNPGYKYKQIEKLDTDKRAYGWLPLTASSLGGQIGVLWAESFCERILVEADDVCHDGNALLDTEEINMLVVLRMIENSYNTCVKSNPRWVVKISMEL